MLRLTTLMLLLAIPAAGAAQSNTPPIPAPNAAAEPPAVPVKEKKVCIADNRIGSIMPKRVCHTQTEWKEINAANGRNVEQSFDQQNSRRAR